MLLLSLPLQIWYYHPAKYFLSFEKFVLEVLLMIPLSLLLILTEHLPLICIYSVSLEGFLSGFRVIEVTRTPTDPGHSSVYMWQKSVSTYCCCILQGFRDWLEQKGNEKERERGVGRMGLDSGFLMEKLKAASHPHAQYVYYTLNREEGLSLNKGASLVNLSRSSLCQREVFRSYISDGRQLQWDIVCT